MAFAKDTDQKNHAQSDGCDEKILLIHAQGKESAVREEREGKVGDHFLHHVETIRQSGGTEEQLSDAYQQEGAYDAKQLKRYPAMVDGNRFCQPRGNWFDKGSAEN